MPDQPTPRVIAISYFLQSRPAPGQPWQQPPVILPNQTKDTVLQQLAKRRQVQPNWEHRLMQRVTTMTEQPAEETP